MPVVVVLVVGMVVVARCQWVAVVVAVVVTVPVVATVVVTVTA